MTDNSLTDGNDHSLAGMKIVVTRPHKQAKLLAQTIEQAGGIPLLYPLLDITAVQDESALQEQISRLAQFDLAIFISPNAVKYGIAAIRKLAELPMNLRVASVGAGSAKALRELGIKDVTVPTQRFDSEGLLAIPDLQNVNGWRIIIFRGDGGRELLGDTLKERGASVEYATCYLRSKPQLDTRAMLAAKPDAINVTSSEAFDHLWQMLDENGKRALCEMEIFVPHPRIAEMAVQHGCVNVHITASGDDGLLEALQSWASQKPQALRDSPPN